MVQSFNLAKTQLVIKDPTPEEVAIKVNRLGDLPLKNFRGLEEETVSWYINQYGESSSLYQSVGRISVDLGEDKEFFGMLNTADKTPMSRVEMGIISYYHDKLAALNRTSSR